MSIVWTYIVAAHPCVKFLSGDCVPQPQVWRQPGREIDAQISVAPQPETGRSYVFQYRFETDKYQGD